MAAFRQTGKDAKLGCGKEDNCSVALRSCPLSHSLYDDVVLAGKERYFLSVCQASSTSIMIALIRSRQAASLGKMLTTVVHRSISRLRRSRPLVVRSRH